MKRLGRKDVLQPQFLVTEQVTKKEEIVAVKVREEELELVD
jgi:hypothetical protein